VDSDGRKWPWRALNALQGLFYDLDTEVQAMPPKPPKRRQDRIRIVQTLARLCGTGSSPSTAGKVNGIQYNVAPGVDRTKTINLHDAVQGKPDDR
jgi:hypothetical protein